jgi:hypothetical protein
MKSSRPEERILRSRTHLNWNIPAGFFMAITMPTGLFLPPYDPQILYGDDGEGVTVNIPYAVGDY